jgi:hypothetical protein
MVVATWAIASTASACEIDSFTELPLGQRSSGRKHGADIQRFAAAAEASCVFGMASTKLAKPGIGLGRQSAKAERFAGGATRWRLSGAASA